MSAPPWMPLYIAEYLADTGHLSAAEHGAYMLLIMHYWQNGSLPVDDRKLARICRMTDAEWDDTKPTLAEFFDDGWQHGRIEQELDTAQQTIAKRSAAGKAGASARYRTRMANAKQTNAPLPIPEPLPEEAAQQDAPRAKEKAKPLPPIPVSLKRERDADWFEAIEVEAREAAGLENEPSPGLLDTSPLVTLIDQGYDFSRDILPKLREAKARGKRGRTWSYYVPAIMETKAANGSIPTKPTTTPGPPMVWITEDDPRFPAFARRAFEADGKQVVARGSRHEPGIGHHFPADWSELQSP